MTESLEKDGVLECRQRLVFRGIAGNEEDMVLALDSPETRRGTIHAEKDPPSVR